MKDLLTNILAGVSAVLAILLSFNILPIDMVNVLSEAIPQILLGISWAALYVGSLKSLTENNQENATAASLLNSTSSISFIFGPIFAFFIYTFFESYELIMLFAAFFSLVSMVFWIFGEPPKTIISE